MFLQFTLVIYKENSPTTFILDSPLTDAKDGFSADTSHLYEPLAIRGTFLITTLCVSEFCFCTDMLQGAANNTLIQNEYRLTILSIIPSVGTRYNPIVKILNQVYKKRPLFSNMAPNFKLSYGNPCISWCFCISNTILRLYL